MLNLAPGRNVIPGSEGITSMYDKIIKKSGYDPEKETEDIMQASFNKFMENAKAGRIQGSGKYAKKFAPTAMGFNEYLTADAAYNLHQGQGGRMQDEQIKNIDWSKL